MSELAFPKSKKANKSKTSPVAQCKAYADQARKLGCVVTGQLNIQMHHLEGREFHHQKIHVGHWWQIPLAFHLHDVSSNDPLCVTHHKNAFHEQYGQPNELLRKSAEACRRVGIDYPEQMLELADDYYCSFEDTSDIWMKLLA